MTVIAEKLAHRKDLVARIGRLDDEISAALVYEEDEDPAKTEAARVQADRLTDELFLTLNDSLVALEVVENEIRQANNQVTVIFNDVGMTLSEAIVYRDRLKTEYHAIDTIAKVVEQVTTARSRRSWGGYGERRKKDEIQQHTVRSARQLREAADTVARKLRLLDAAIQKVNWSAEVD